MNMLGCDIVLKNVSSHGSGYPAINFADADPEDISVPRVGPECSGILFLGADMDKAIVFHRQNHEHETGTGSPGSGSGTGLDYSFEGSVSGDFRPPVFFMIQTHLGP